MNNEWREEMKAYTSSKYHLELLENGPTSLSQSWILNALHQKWEKIKGIKHPIPPDCSSSFKEWNDKVKDGA